MYWRIFNVLCVLQIFDIYSVLLFNAFCLYANDLSYFLFALQVEFPNSLYIERIDIYETLNGGAITSIKALSPSDGMVTIFTDNNAPTVITNSRIFTPDIDVSETLGYIWCTSWLHYDTYSANHSCSMIQLMSLLDALWYTLVSFLVALWYIGDTWLHDDPTEQTVLSPIYHILWSFFLMILIIIYPCIAT